MIESGLFPAAFAIPQGVYVVKARYGDRSGPPRSPWPPGERAEVRVTFATGELFLQALDAAGGEIVGDSAGFAALGADVFPAGKRGIRAGGKHVQLPARWSWLRDLSVRARWKGIERLSMRSRLRPPRVPCARLVRKG